MIMKDEEEFLDGSLKSAQGIFDEVVVVDTGSADNSAEIARQNGAKLFNFQWIGDFAAARNFAAGKASNDWVFMLDADEKIKEFEKERIVEFIKDPFNLGSVSRLEMYDSSLNQATRLYNRKQYEYRGKIHEQVMPVDQREHVKNIFEVPILLEHYGYLPDVMASKTKLKRNEEMLLAELAENPNDPYILYQLGKSFFAMSRDLVKACEYFEKSLEQSPDVQLKYVYSLVECYGYALINSGQYKKAYTLANKYRTYYERTAQFRFLMAHIYQNNGMYIEAVECYESCIGAEATDYRGLTSFLSYYNIGVIVECLGMASDAKRMYEKCGHYEPALKRLRELEKSKD